MKERIFYYDEIRFLAILMVLLIHVSKWFQHEEIVGSLFWTFSTTLEALGNIGVPLFLMISGALLLNRKYELKSFYKKRVVRIFTPFCFWIVFIVLFKILFMGHGHSFGDIINIIFFEGFIWFVWMIIGLYLFIPVINSYIREYHLRGCECFLIIWFITIILSTFNSYPIKNIELRYFSGYLGYLVLGWYLSNKEFKFKHMKLAGALIFLISFVFNIYLITSGTVDSNTYLSSDFYLSALAVIEATGIFLFFRYAREIKNSMIRKIIYSISICSYGMYLTHYFFIWSAQILIGGIFLKNPIIWIPIMFIATVCGSWITIWIFSKIPYLNKVSGV